MTDEQDFTDPAYVLGAVLAQLEDLDDEGAAEVLDRARAARVSLPLDVVDELRAWQPDERQFVIVTQPHWERIQNAVEGAGIGALLDGITVMPVELDAEDES